MTLASGVGGDTDEAFAYDAMGRLLEAQDDDSTVQFTYDSLSRISTEIQGPNPLGSSGKTVSYTYDAEGNRTKIDYPDGFGGSAFDANEARDALGRLTQITDGSAATIASFDLYGAGARKKKTTLANSTTANYAWDGFRRPTDIDHKDSGGTRFAGFAYAWDKSDNPLMEARSHKSGKGDVYTYDRANRLTKVLRDVDDPAAELASPGTEIYDKKLEYVMDDVLNLSAYTVTPYGGSPSTTSYTTNAMNEYTAIGGASPTYTDNGALASDGTYTYKYDGHDRLIEVKQGTTTVATYAYDALGLGRRTKKTVGSAVTKYVYAGQQSIEELDGSGTLQRLFVFGDRIDEILAMDAPDQADVDGDSNTSEVLRFSYHTQLIGSVTHVTAPSGALAEQYEYDPYGNVTIKDGSGSTLSASAIGNAYTFTARQLDEETGLYYYRARMYSAELRRFIQRDPLEYVDGPNALGYCRGSVTIHSDPSGLDGMDVFRAMQAAVYLELKQEAMKDDRNYKNVKGPDGQTSRIFAWIGPIGWLDPPTDWNPKVYETEIANATHRDARAFADHLNKLLDVDQPAIAQDLQMLRDEWVTNGWLPPDTTVEQMYNEWDKANPKNVRGHAPTPERDRMWEALNGGDARASRLRKHTQWERRPHWESGTNEHWREFAKFYSDQDNQSGTGQRRYSNPPPPSEYKDYPSSPYQRDKT